MEKECRLTLAHKFAILEIYNEDLCTFSYTQQSYKKQESNKDAHDIIINNDRYGRSIYNYEKLLWIFKNLFVFNDTPSVLIKYGYTDSEEFDISAWEASNSIPPTIIRLYFKVDSEMDRPKFLSMLNCALTNMSLFNIIDTSESDKNKYTYISELFNNIYTLHFMYKFLNGVCGIGVSDLGDDIFSVISKYIKYEKSIDRINRDSISAKMFIYEYIVISELYEKFGGRFKSEIRLRQHVKKACTRRKNSERNSGVWGTSWSSPKGAKISEIRKFLDVCESNNLLNNDHVSSTISELVLITLSEEDNSVETS